MYPTRRGHGRDTSRQYHDHARCPSCDTAIETLVKDGLDRKTGVLGRRVLSNPTARAQCLARRSKEVKHVSHWT